MKNKSMYITGLLFVVLLIIGVRYAEPYKASVPEVQESFDPEALAIRDKLLTKSIEYGAKTKRQEEIKQEFALIESEKADLAKTAAAYDAILCHDYGLQFIRPTSASGSGTLTKGCEGF